MVCISHEVITIICVFVRDFNKELIFLGHKGILLFLIIYGNEVTLHHMRTN